VSVQSKISGASAGARTAVHGTSTTVAWLGRAGYAARGVLYLTIGVLAAMVALGQRGGKLADSRGALDELHTQPFGVVLLLLLAVGLAGYGIWRLAQAALDPAHEATGRWALGKRGAWVVEALLHFALAGYALSRLRGDSGSGESDLDAKSGTASALSWEPFGPALVAVLGASLLGIGVYELVCAFRAKLDEQLDLSPLAATTRRRIVQLSRFGIAARGVVFAIAGVFLFIAAVTSDPQQAKGFGDSLQALREAPFGMAILACVALGLVAFGVYQLVEARYRRLAGLER